jgi:NADH-quinone oxidoreductase subunit A
MDAYIPYLMLLGFLVAGMLLYGVGMLVSSLIRPSRPDAEKLSTYECGEEAVGEAWGRFNARFYKVAIVFVLFEVELIFLFPWAVVFADPAIAKLYPVWSWLSLAEIALFIGFLSAGLWYAIQCGVLSWSKPKTSPPPTSNPVPNHLYDSVNTLYK